MDEQIKIIKEKVRELAEQIRIMGADLDGIMSDVEALGNHDPEQWPKNGDAYYYVTYDGFVSRNYWVHGDESCGAKAVGNVFRTCEEAEERAQILRWLAASPNRWASVKAGWEHENQYQAR